LEKYKNTVLLLVLLIGVIIVSLFIENKPEEIIYRSGTYEGIGNGHHGPIKILVTTNEYKIIKIDIIEEYEMPEVSKFVYEEIPKLVIKKNSADIDMVSGATFTSEGLIKAIEDGLKKASLKND